ALRCLGYSASNWLHDCSSFRFDRFQLASLNIFQNEPQCFHCLNAMVRFLFKCLENRLLEACRYLKVRADHLERSRFFGYLLEEQIENIVTGKQGLAGDCLIHDATERIDIGPIIKILSATLLGTHI